MQRLSYLTRVPLKSQVLGFPGPFPFRTSLELCDSCWVSMGNLPPFSQPLSPLCSMETAGPPLHRRVLIMSNSFLSSMLLRGSPRPRHEGWWQTALYVKLSCLGPEGLTTYLAEQTHSGQAANRRGSLHSQLPTGKGGVHARQRIPELAQYSPSAIQQIHRSTPALCTVLCYSWGVAGLVQGKDHGSQSPGCPREVSPCEALLV